MPVGITVIVVVVVLVGALLWHKYMAPPSTAPSGTAASAGASSADMQKNPNPQDLAKQYGYQTPQQR